MSDYSVDPGATIERLIAEREAALGDAESLRESLRTQTLIINSIANARDAALALIKTHEDAMAHVLERENVLQHRLTAADERADVLETALKKISVRCVAYIEAEREMPEPSVEVCQMIADAALKPAECNDSCEFCKGWGFRANPDGADEGCGACNGTGKEPAEGGGDEA